MKILVTPNSLQPDRKSPALEELRAFADELVFNDLGHPLSEEELIPRIQGCDGYVAGVDNVTAKVMDACPGLKVISRYGVGVDRVDLAAAAERGIIVTNTPGANAEAVGELTFALILALARQIPMLDRTLRAGQWVHANGTELKGKTIGILGLGAIGKVAARCAQGFDMDVIAYDPYINEEYCSAHRIRIGTLEEVLRAADVVSLHLPLMEQTRHMIGADELAIMKKGALLVNASRGGILDEDAVLEALKSGQLGGLALDAFEVEPPEASPFFELDNVVVTPHTGAHTKEAAQNMASMAISNLKAVLTGGDCPYIVTPRS